jgi:hypothetical protein
VKLPVFSLLTPTLLHNDQKVYFAVHFQYLHPLRNQGNTEKLLKNRSAIDFFLSDPRGCMKIRPYSDSGFYTGWGEPGCHTSHSASPNAGYLVDYSYYIFPDYSGGFGTVSTVTIPSQNNRKFASIPKQVSKAVKKDRI